MSPPIFEAVQQRVERRIRRYKTRFNRRRRESNGLEAEFADQIMTVRDATAQMDLLGHNFFMFRNRDNGDINVVYRRHDDDHCG
jgi:putative sigma-54 modulation protein